MPMHDNTTMKPRNGINLTLCLLIQASSISILWVAPQANLITGLILLVILSFILLTNYCLLHEASHNNLNSNKTINWVLGTVSGCLFPVSYTFYKNVHIFHHQNNRSEHERFEYYNPEDSAGSVILRHLQWYSIVIGTFWLFIPIMSLISAVLPWLLKSWPLNTFIATSRMFDRFESKQLRMITIETVIIVIYWSVLWIAIEPGTLTLMIAYGIFAFNWSSRQYIAHAFTPLDKDEGAINLKVNSLMEKLLLYSNWHLEHHKHPKAPWHMLPELSQNQPSYSYLTHYIQLWNAPKILPSEPK